MQKWISAALAALVLVRSAQAQFAGQPNEGLTITTGATSGTYVVSWWGKGGRTYFIKQSSDLMNWSYFPVIESGVEDVISWGLTTSAPNLFIKLEGTDIPTSDPANTDFAGDGMTALWKLRVGLDPLVWVDPNTLDPSGDGLTYYQNFLVGTSPFVATPVITLTAPAGATLVP